jgi:polysaccharide deacetylase 2 family uncharacterized protein YibQ
VVSKISSQEEKDPVDRKLVLGYMESLRAVLKDRYEYRLIWPQAGLSDRLKVDLPSWMNLTYLKRLGKLALARTDWKSAPTKIVAGEKPGAGSLVVELPLGKDSIFSLTLVKPAAASRVCLVVDDVGYGGRSTGKLLALPAPFSVAILPFYHGSKSAAVTAVQHGLEAMLHFPMQPKGAEGKYRKNVVVGRHLKAAEIRRRTLRDLDSLPGITGLNNHMGSLGTESWYVMGEVLPIVKKRNMFFLDSVTTARSVAYRAARKLGVPTTRRTASFLDNDVSYEGVSKAFKKLLAVCKPGTTQISILHDKPDSVRAMTDAIPLFRERNIEMVFAGELAREE